MNCLHINTTSLNIYLCQGINLGCNGKIMKGNFKIVRFYAPDMFKENRVIKTGLTEAEAQAHCQRADTRKEGVYFDGYTDGGE